jgi:hypothetical protein
LLPLWNHDLAGNETDTNSPQIEDSVIVAGWEIDEERTANQRGTESPPLVEVLDDEELPVDSSEIEGCTANQEPDDDEVVDSSEIEDCTADQEPDDDEVVDSSEIEDCTADQEPDDDEVVDSSDIEDCTADHSVWNLKLMDDSANCAKRYFFHGYQCVLCSNDVERTTKKLPPRCFVAKLTPGDSNECEYKPSLETPAYHCPCVWTKAFNCTYCVCYQCNNRVNTGGTRRRRTRN